MRTLSILFILVYLSSCKPHSRKKLDPRATKLVDSAISLWHEDDATKSKREILFLDSIFYLKKINLLNKAIHIDSTYLDAYLTKFDYQKELRQIDSMIVTGQQLLKISPNAGEIALRLGECYEWLGDTLSSMKYYQRSLSILNKKSNKASLYDLGSRLGELDRAVNLILLKRNTQARDLLKKLSEAAANPKERSLYQAYMIKPRHKFVEDLIP